VAIDRSPSRHDQSGGTMMTEPDAIQRRWARVVGFSYLFALAPAVFAELYVSGRLIVSDNAIATAQNIIAHERLFRLGIASNLLVFATDVVLVTALYVVLERVNRRLALLATFFRLIETTILIVAVLNDFYVLRLLSGASYLTTVNSDQLALVRVSIGAHGSAYGVALLLFGFGSPVFCYLWLRSGYIPKPLAVWGLLASAWIGICSFTFVVFPELTKVITIGYYGGPIFLFELTIGLWLLFKGVPASRRS
jgi:hypothetical protein